MMNELLLRREDCHSWEGLTPDIASTLMPR